MDTLYGGGPQAASTSATPCPALSGPTLDSRRGAPLDTSGNTPPPTRFAALDVTIPPSSGSFGESTLPVLPGTGAPVVAVVTIVAVPASGTTMPGLGVSVAAEVPLPRRQNPENSHPRQTRHRAPAFPLHCYALRLNGRPQSVCRECNSSGIKRMQHQPDARAGAIPALAWQGILARASGWFLPYAQRAVSRSKEQVSNRLPAWGKPRSLGSQPEGQVSRTVCPGIRSGGCAGALKLVPFDRISPISLPDNQPTILPGARKTRKIIEYAHFLSGGYGCECRMVVRSVRRVRDEGWCS